MNPSSGSASRAKTVKEWPWVWLGVALLVRLGCLLWSGSYTPFGDPVEYDAIGRSLADRGQYIPSLLAEPGSPSAYRPPGYPYWLAGIYAVSGNDMTVARVVGVILGVLTVLLIWLIARRVAGDRIARFTAAIAALAPSLAWVSGGLVAETLYIPLMLGSVLVVLRFRDSPSTRLALIAGFLIGASTLTRTNGLILFLPIALGVWQARRRWPDVALLTAGLIVALAPWTIRNLVVLDAFAPLGTQTGITLVGVFNHNATASAYFGIFRPPDKIATTRALVRQPGINEAELDARSRRIAIDFALDHPGYIRGLLTRHAQQLFEIRGVRITSSNSQREMAIPVGFARKISRGGFLLLLALSVAGAIIGRSIWWRREHLWLWLVPIMLLVSVILLVGGPRYRLPIDPFLSLLAAGAIPALLRVSRGRRAPAA